MSDDLCHSPPASQGPGQFARGGASARPKRPNPTHADNSARTPTNAPRVSGPCGPQAMAARASEDQAAKMTEGPPENSGHPGRAAQRVPAMACRSLCALGDAQPRSGQGHNPAACHIEGYALIACACPGRDIWKCGQNHRTTDAPSSGGRRRPRRPHTPRPPLDSTIMRRLVHQAFASVACPRRQQRLASRQMTNRVEEQQVYLPRGDWRLDHVAGTSSAATPRKKAILSS